MPIIHEEVKQMSELNGEIAKAVHMPELERQVIVGAIALEGAVLFEGSPSTGKTRSASVISTAVGGRLGRVQGNPDIMPADITGTRYYDLKTGEWKNIEGPIFSNIFFVDELNRMPTKSQAALLEAMQEKQVTIAGATKSRELARPFIVLATQNPNENSQGTNPLTVAQLDRFNVRITMPPLEGDDRRAAKKLMSYQPSQIINSVNDIVKMTSAVESLAVHNSAEIYADNLVDNLRQSQIVDPKRSALDGLRASVQLIRYAQALAMQQGDSVVDLEHVDLVAPFVLGHRTHFTYEGLEQGYTPEQALEEVKESLKNKAKKG